MLEKIQPTFSQILDAIEFVSAKYNNTEVLDHFNFVGTDSWDITSLENKVAAEFLQERSYVIIPSAHHDIERFNSLVEHIGAISPSTSGYFVSNMGSPFKWA